MSTAEAGGPGANGSEPIGNKADGAEIGDNAPSSEAVETGLSVDDILLPRSVIMRLAKDMLPPGTGVQRDAVTAILKAATVFVSYISSHANDMTDKKTLTPQDVLAALTEVELEDFRPHLEKQLEMYTALMESKRESKKKGKLGNEATGGSDDRAGAKRLKRDHKEEEKDPDKDTAGGSVSKASSRSQQGSIQAGGDDDADNDDDDTEVMDDANLSNDEDHHEELEEEEEEEEDEEEENEEPGENAAGRGPEDMDRIEDSDAARRRRAADSGSGSDSD